MERGHVIDLGIDATAFGTLNTVWRSTAYSNNTKIRIFNTNVKSVLLYGCETWKLT